MSAHGPASQQPGLRSYANLTASTRHHKILLDACEAHEHELSAQVMAGQRPAGLKFDGLDHALVITSKDLISGRERFPGRGAHKHGGARVEGQVGGQARQLLAHLDHALARVCALRRQRARVLVVAHARHHLHLRMAQQICG